MLRMKNPLVQQRTLVQNLVRNLVRKVIFVPDKPWKLQS